MNGTRGYNQVGPVTIRLQFYNDRVQVNLNNGSVNLALAEGVMHDVFVSSIVGGGECSAQVAAVSPPNYNFLDHQEPVVAPAS